MSNKNENKKIQIVLSITAILSVTFSYQYFKNIQINELQTMAKTQKNKPKTPKQIDQVVVSKQDDEAKRPSRGIASVPTPSVLRKYQNRKVVGQLRKDKDVIIGNEISKDWKEKAYKRLNDMITDETKLEIRTVKPVVFIQHGMGKYAEHVKVVLQRKNGLRSAYDAYIDSQSGAIIRTWNRTKFEIKPTVYVQSHGNEFTGVPLNIQQDEDSNSSL